MKFIIRTENFKQSFFPLRKAENDKLFKSMLKDFFDLKQKSLFAIHDPADVKLLSRLRLKFSHLNEDKFCRKLKMLWALYVTVAPELKEQTTFSCDPSFLQ